MEFTDHLIVLFYRHDCIIIPGLGGFKAKYLPAGVDKKQGIVKPPVKSFDFDDRMVKDNGLMAGFIASSWNIPDDEAHAMLVKFAEETRKIVLGGNQAEVPGLGYFYLTVDERIDFHFTIENNFNPETVGEKDARLPKIPVKETAKNETMKEEPHPINRKKSPARYFVPLFALLALIVVVIVYIPTVSNRPLIGNVIKKLRISQRSTPADIRPPVVIGPGEKAEEGKPDTVSPVRETTEFKRSLSEGSKESSAARYYLIAGSFKDIRNAEQLSSKLTLEGYKTEILSTNDGWHRVSVMWFINRDQALKALNEIKSSGRLSSVWLLSI
mgnify:FL=1